MTEIIFLSALGVLVGFLSGMFGIGGGVIIVPSLIFLYSFTGLDSPYIVHVSIATSLFTVIFTSIASSYKHFRNQNVIWSAALIIGISSSITAFLFSLVALNMSGEVLKKIFAVVLCIVSLKLLFEKNTDSENKISSKEFQYNRVFCFITGLFAGIIAAFAGLGGGIFIIPLLYYVLKFPFKMAVGTSSAAIILTAFSGVISYFLNAPSDFVPGKYFFGMVDITYAIPVIIFSIISVNLGIYVNKRTNNILLRKLFGVITLLISFRMFFF